MTTATLADLTAVVGSEHVLTAADTTLRYVVDERRLYHGAARAVVRPATTQEVAAVVAICARDGIGMVPQGGNTGYCGGATPDNSGSEIVISLERLNRVLAVDTHAYTMTVQAGVILADAQAAASAHGLLLPLSMGSQSSCQIGGNLSTNAGGLAVLKYGTARDLVLGLEVVLADGRVCNELRALRKDNTGYDVKQLFVGAEGTLGIITAAVLKLFPDGPRQTAWLAVADCGAACALLADLRQATGDGVTSFEYMTAAALSRLTEAMPEVALPLGLTHAHQVLVECLAGGEQQFEQALSLALERGLVVDAVIGSGPTQTRALWAIREAIPAAEKRLGGSVKHDVSLALGDIASYIDEVQASIVERYPGVRLSIYGHLGDGNVHFNVLAPPAVEAEAYKLAHGADISALVHDRAHALGGSYSAEHGIGHLKRELLAHYADKTSLSVMRTIKAALDPRGLMNPGKLLVDAGTFPLQSDRTP